MEQSHLKKEFKLIKYGNGGLLSAAYYWIKI